MNKNCKVTISVKSLYDKLDELRLGHIIPDFDENGKEVYYDLYNNFNELACLDGEEVTIVQWGNEFIDFVNTNGETSVYFALTPDECKICMSEEDFYKSRIL